MHQGTEAPPPDNYPQPEPPQKEAPKKPKSPFPYEPGERSLPEILSDLSKPVPTRLLESKRQGGAELTFIPWHQCIRLMDLYAPGWEGRVKEVALVTGLDKDGNRCDLVRVTYQVMIVYKGKGGFTETVIRESTGFERFDKQSFGDPFSNAESMAKRRAFAQFGLGLHLYRGEV